MILKRTTGGRAPYGVWDFNWQGQGRVLEIIGPWSVILYETIVVNDIPVKTQRSVRGAGSAFLEVESLTYETIPHPVSPVPAVKTVTLERDTAIYTTTYTYATNDWANYGQPTQIVQVGGLTRTTAVTYNHGFSKYIRGRVASTTTTVNGLASMRTFAYNGTTGFLTSETSLGVTTTYAASGTGNVASIWDAANRRTDFGYSWGVASSVTSPVSSVAVTRGINTDGSVAWEQSTGTAQTTYAYDNAGRVTSVSSSTPGRVPVTTAYTHTNGRWVGTTSTRGTVWSTATIDGFGRPTDTLDSAGVQTRTTYHPQGFATYQSHPYGAGVPEVGNTLGYDRLGRLVDVFRPDGSYVSYFYNASTIGVQESTGPGTYRNTGQYYHWFSPGDGPMWRFVDAALGDWRYSYNGRGQLTEVRSATDINLPSRGWGYDAQGRLTTVVQPESGTSTFQYNAVGNPTQTTDALGTTTYSYNSDHQVTLVNAPGTADDVTYTYDTAGRVATVSNPTVQTTLAYDSSSRVTSRTDVIAGKTFVQTFVYDGYDNLIQVNYPLTGRKVFYDYNAQQRLTAVRTQISTGPVTTLAGSFVYRGDGSLASYTFGNGQTASVTPDNRRRPKDWINGPLSVSYTYDHVSNIKTVDDVRPGMDSQFTYDALDRLTTVTGFGATSYGYSPSGDRTVAGTVNFHYDANTRRLMSLSGTESGSFGYNAVGSLTSDPSGATYTYTTLNMLKTATLGSQTTTFQYGGDGMRAVKTGPDGIPRLYVYGGSGGPIGEYKVVGGVAQVEREYVYLGSQLLASFAPSPITPPPLSVAIATPAPSQQVLVGQTIQLTATASVGGGLTIARVEYYNGGQFIGQAATAPYTVPFTNGGNGTLPPTVVLRARVVATNGQAAASSPVTITIQQ